MKTLRTVSLAVQLLAMTFSSMADGGNTREQVKAELAEARRTGNMVGSGESGWMLNELYPQLYPAKPAAQSKTREQVKAELAEARRTGNILASGESGRMLNELYPDRYPAQPILARKSRDEVRRELAQAQRLGNIQVGENGLTLAELFPHRYAKARAEQALYLKRLADDRSSQAIMAR